jgi:hypothetical protein
MAVMLFIELAIALPNVPRLDPLDVLRWTSSMRQWTMNTSISTTI